MPIDTVKITGTLNFPDATWSNFARISFQLSGFDTNGAVVVPKVITKTLTSSGALDVDIWPNADGLRGTVYRVFVDIYTDGTFANLVSRVDLGRIQVSGDADIKDLIDSPITVPEVWYSVITQAEYDAAIQAASSAAQSAQDALSAYQGRQYATRAAFVADTGYTPADGTVVSAGGVQFVRDASATAIADLPGWVPFGVVTPEHYGLSNVVIVPTDIGTLQEVFDRFGADLIEKIEVRLASGHALTTGIILSNGDWSGYTITSVDATVSLASGFAGNVIRGENARMPTLDCLIDAINQATGNGISINACEMTILPGRGVINAYGTGLATRNACVVTADGTNFSGAARNGSTGAGITAWASFVSAENADVSNSGYYGAQAAHGGTLAFLGGNANDAARYGIRATDRASIDADGASASNAGVYNVYAFQNSDINFVGGTATGGGVWNAVCTRNSRINMSSSNLSAGVEGGVLITATSSADANSADISGCGTKGASCSNASSLSLFGANCRKGEVDSVEDIVCTGGTIYMSGTTGGTSQAVNIQLSTGTIINADQTSWGNPAIVAANHNYDPGIRNKGVFWLERTIGAATISGIVASTDEREIVLVNRSATNFIVLLHQSTSSEDANRFDLPSEQSHYILPGSSVTLKYFFGKWRLIDSGGRAAMKSHTVSTLPNANPAGQQIYVSDETDGAVMAFSDGTNWRRVTDRAIVS